MDIYSAWKELKETVTELRDNGGTGSQKDICHFLANYMDTLERQIKESLTQQKEILTGKEIKRK